MNEYTGQFLLNSISPHANLVSSWEGPPSWIADYLSFDGSGDYILLNTSDAVRPSILTFVAQVKLKGNTGTDYICGHSRSSNLSYGFSYDGTNVYMNVFNGFTIYSSTGFPVTTGTWYTLVGTYDGANIRLWVNGISAGVPVACNDIHYGTTPESKKVCFGASYESGAGAANVDIKFVYLYNMLLDETAAKQLYREPYCMFR
jgi:hypothetical protein